MACTGPGVPKITLQSEMCTSVLRQLVIAVFAPVIKEESQDPSDFCHSCFHNQLWLFGKAEGQGQGSLLVPQSLQGQSACVSHTGIVGARGKASQHLQSSWQGYLGEENGKTNIRNEPQPHHQVEGSLHPHLTSGPSARPYFLWNLTTGSSSRSVKSSFLPFSMTSRCLRMKSQPMWEKKKPRRALCGSASVSEYLWCTRWSRLHS